MDIEKIIPFVATNHSKKTGFIIGLVAASIAIILWLNSNKNNLISSEHHTQLEITQTASVEYGLPGARQQTAQQPTQPITQTTQQTLSPLAADFQSIMGNPADMAQVKSWFDTRGYVYWGEANNEYGSYSEDTLKKLSAGGDIRAMKKLGDLYYGEFGFDKAKEVYLDAAVHGSTDAIHTIGTMISISIFDKAKTPETKQAAAIETLAWYNAASLRGDRWPNIVGAKDFIKIENFQVTKEISDQIQKRSQEIYDDLAQKRRSLGLGEFDNTIPVSVESYFQQLEMP